jgi:hypothetical protein
MYLTVGWTAVFVLPQLPRRVTSGKKARKREVLLVLNVALPTLVRDLHATSTELR